MFVVENNDITMTKGDSGFFTVAFENGDGTEFVLGDGDEVIFSVKRKKEGFCPIVIEKRGEKIIFDREDTEDIASGEYVYDVMICRNTGERYTAIEGKFTLRKAVHNFE